MPERLHRLSRALAGRTIDDPAVQAELRSLLEEDLAWKQAFLDASLDAIIIMDSTGTVREWNAAATQTFGYTVAEAVGKELAQLIVPEELRARHRAGLQRYLATGQATVLGARIEITGVRKDATMIPVELAIVPFTLRDERWFCGYLRDLTERRSLEESRKRLVTMAAHELSNPLTPLALQMQILQLAVGPDAKVQQALAVMDRNVVRLRLLVADLLDAARMDSGSFRLASDAFDLADEARNAAAGQTEVAAEKGLQLTLQVDGPAPVLADRRRIGQVIDNLLSNALKFTPQGGTVTLTVGTEQPHAVLSVADTGRGIAAHDLSRLFKAFSRVGPRAGTEGTGLGLYITRGIVESSGGTIDVSSEGAGKGATFTLRLPLAK